MDTTCYKVRNHLTFRDSNKDSLGHLIYTHPGSGDSGGISIGMSEKQIVWVIVDKFVIIILKIELRHEKTCLRGLGPGKTQTSLRSYRD